MTNLSQIKEFCSMFDSEILYVFPYGSQVYGTTTPKSDFDYVVIVDKIDARTYLQEDLGGIDIHALTMTKFQGYLDKMNAMCLECFFTEPIYSNAVEPLKPLKFNEDIHKLREAISSKVNNSYAKAKKKITLEDESDYIGVKSLFHSMRLIDLGIQVAEYKKGVDLRRMSPLWEEIYEDFYNLGLTWEDLHKKYKPKYNALMTEFRKLAPKE